ncbi:MAG TPA: DUF2267 domain-containing protein [Paracoccaceae bacterium]|nr:DUF2267 domain-containing protein [Paracoccaceae bacterium]
MPMPYAYRHASREFRAFLDDAKARLELVSENSTYTAVEGVFRTFRRRIPPQQALAFADLLPAVPRAIFVSDWRLDHDIVPFGTRDEWIREVQALRPHHNLTPDHAIEAVAWALRRHVRQRELDRLLSLMPSGAIAFWHVDVDDPRELERRII